MATQPATREVNPQFAEFEEARKRIRSGGQQELQRRRDALKRQFARLGGVGSGAFIKATEQQEADVAGQQEAALGQVEAAEATTRRQIQEQERQREFASTEAERQRQFARGERIGAQEFTSEQAELERRQRADFFRTESGQRQQALDLQKILELGNAEMGLVGDAALRQMQFQLDRETTAFNKIISASGVADKTVMFSLLSSLAVDESTPPSLQAAMNAFIGPALSGGIPVYGIGASAPPELTTPGSPFYAQPQWMSNLQNLIGDIPLMSQQQLLNQLAPLNPPAPPPRPVPRPPIRPGGTGETTGGRPPGAGAR